MTGPRRTYDDAQREAFLREASLPGSAIHTVARAHGISSGTAYRWLHEARDADPPPSAVAVLLSGYAHEVYDPLILAGWERIEWQTSCHAVGRTRHSGIQGAGSATAKQARVESVWLNPVLRDRLGRQTALLLEAEA